MRLSLNIFFFYAYGTLALADLYQILGTHPEASSDELKKAYLKKARELHPDVSRLPKEEAEKAFKELQSAWEAVQKKQGRKGPETSRRDLAQKQAERVLEKAWAENRFGTDTFNELPRWKKAQELSSLSPLHSRGPEEEGEWLAVSNFLRSKQAEILSSQASVLEGVLEKLETYFSLTGQSVQNIRAGFLEPFEMAVLKQARTKEEFLEAFQKRGERLLRAGTFSWGESKEIFSDKFGGAKPLSELEMAQELLQTRFEMIKRSPPTLHEAGFFLRALLKALSKPDQLSLLESFKKQISFLPREFRRQGSFKDLEVRLQQATERLISKNPELQKPSSSFLKTLSEACGRVLKRFR